MNLNQSDNNELLFWKVIKNRFLFNNIFEQIKNNEWVQYFNPEHIHLENRKKFKDIISMKWMINNKQYQPLKCKLENNEYIKINSKGLKLLFNQLNDCCGSNTTFETLLLILELLLKKKKLEIELCEIDLIFEQINQYIQICNKQQQHQQQHQQDIDTKLILKILVDNLLPVYPFVLELTIAKLSPSIILILLESTDFKIKRLLKERSIFLAFSNKQYKESMLKFILDNPNLYLSEKNTLPNKINFLDILSLESTEIKIKLFETKSYKLSPFSESNVITNILNDKNLKDQDKIKEIYKKLTIISPNEFYFNYLKEYNEIVDEIIDKDFILYKYSLSTMNKAALQWLINKNKNNPSDQKNILLLNCRNYNDIYTTSLYQKYNKKNNSTIPINDVLEFLKQYTSQTLIKNQHFDQEIGNLISNVSCDQEFQQLIASITNNRFNEYIPKKWNPILKEIVNWFGNRTDILISNKETIDWLIENSKSNNEYKVIVRKLESIKNPFSIFKIESFDLIEYTYLKLKDSTDSILYLDSNLDGSLFYFLFLNSIKTCNVDQLKCIKTYTSSLPTIKQLPFDNFKSKDLTIINPNTENIVFMVEYLNNEYNNKDNLFLYKNEQFFYNFAVMVAELYNQKNELFDLCKIKLKFCNFSKTATEMFKEAIDKYNAPLIQLILNYNNSIACQMVFSNNDIFNLKGTNGQCTQLLTTPPSNASNIIRCIQILINHYSSSFNTASKNHNTSIEHRNLIKNATNQLFLRLIKTNGLTIETLKSVYQKITESKITIEHSLVYSVYYLSIRSPKLVKYILDQPFLENYSCYRDNDHYFIGKPTGYKIEEYLDPNSFTFDYIFNSGVLFDELLFKLIHHLSHLPANNNELISKQNHYFNVSLNTNLEFLLEIRRQDLFFKELNYIQHQLKSDLIIGSFPQMAEYNNGGGGCGKNKNNKNQPIKKCCILIEKELYKDRVFHFSDRVYEISCNTMDSNSFKQFAQFSCFHSLIYYLNSLLRKSNDIIFQHLLNQFDNINHIISQHSTIIDKEIQYFWFDIFKNEKRKLIISNHSIIKHQNILINLMGSDDDDHNENINNFLENLTKGNIYNVEIFQILLNFNMKQHHPYLKISKSIIDDSIRLEKINFLKYLYENGFIKDKNLIVYLEKKLIMSKQYFYWLK